MSRMSFLVNVCGFGGAGSRRLDSSRRDSPKWAGQAEHEAREPDQNRGIQDQEVPHPRGGRAQDRHPEDQPRARPQGIEHQLAEEEELEKGTVDKPQSPREGGEHEPRPKPAEHLVREIGERHHAFPGQQQSPRQDQRLEVAGADPHAATELVPDPLRRYLPGPCGGSHKNVTARTQPNQHRDQEVIDDRLAGQWLIPIYAFRRERYQPLPSETIVDDFLIPMLIRLRSGGHIFMAPAARAWEISPERVRDEFRRRVRIGAGDLQALILTWRLPLPGKGMVALAYLSHKVFRWLGPWLMLAALAGTLGLIHRPFFQLLFLGQLMLYALGAGAGLVLRVPVLGAAASGVRYFLVLNAAILVGFARFMLGLARPFWTIAPRRV